MTQSNRIKEQAQDALLIEGIQKNLTGVATLYLGGETFTPPTLTAYIQRHFDAIVEVETRRAQWLASVSALATLSAQARVVEHDLKQFVIGFLGAKSPKLADFGYKPRKIPTRTTADKLVAVAKAHATRTARHTMGPKAKLAITGLDPTGTPAVAPPVVTVTPLVPAPAATPEPATKAAAEAPANATQPKA